MIISRETVVPTSSTDTLARRSFLLFTVSRIHGLVLYKSLLCIKTLFGIALHLSVAGWRKQLVLASLNGKAKGARVHFSRHNSPNSHALANRSEKTQRL